MSSPDPDEDVSQMNQSSIPSNGKITELSRSTDRLVADKSSVTDFSIDKIIENDKSTQ